MPIDSNGLLLHTGGMMGLFERRFGSCADSMKCLFGQFDAKVAPVGYMKAALTKNPAMNGGVLNPLHTIKRC